MSGARGGELLRLVGYRLWEWLVYRLWGCTGVLLRWAERADWRLQAAHYAAESRLRREEGRRR